jgi:3-hydroxyisobutyrate dehydrogenase-like beta-hydroxyacid dehydrogenase
MGGIGFGGLDSPGIPILRNILHEFKVECIYDHDTAKSELFPGIPFVDEPFRLGSKCSIIFACFRTEAESAAFIAGQKGVLSTMSAGGIIVNLSSTGHSFAKEMAFICGESGKSYIEAPFIGDSKEALDRNIVSLVSGDRSIYSRVEAVISSYSREKYFLTSPHGAIKMKLLLDQLAATILATTMEVYVAAERLGIGREDALKIIGESNGTSKILQTKVDTISREDFVPGVTLSNMVQSMSGIDELSHDPGMSMPISSVANSIYRSAMLLGLGNLDYSAVLKAFRHMDGRL